MTHPDLPLPPRPLAQAWADARADYLAGLSAPVVAERYGLSERSLRRRAASEGWRRVDLPAIPLAPAAPENPRLAERAALTQALPELDEVDAARQSDQFVLLFEPTPDHLRRFAFKKAAEAAATDSPHLAVVWMRLTQVLDRCGDRIHREASAFTQLDLLRAAYLRRVGDGDDSDADADHDADAYDD